MRIVRILNCGFAPVTLSDTIDWARQRIREGDRGYICTVNVAILMMMRSDPSLQRFVDQASMVVADGQPLVWASRLQRDPLPERVTGVDLVDALCGLAVEESFGVYFLGAKRDVIEAAVHALKEQYPLLEVSGIADGYFGDGESEERAAAVRESGAKLLIVGMGVPRQEQFLQQYWDELGATLAIPVGGSFEVFAGTARRAPPQVQRVGLEWAFRLAQEPRRLWKRYLVTNSQFIFHLLKSTLGFEGRQ